MDIGAHHYRTAVINSLMIPDCWERKEASNKRYRFRDDIKKHDTIEFEINSWYQCRDMAVSSATLALECETDKLKKIKIQAFISRHEEMIIEFPPRVRKE